MIYGDTRDIVVKYPRNDHNWMYGVDEFIGNTEDGTGEDQVSDVNSQKICFDIAWLSCEVAFIIGDVMSFVSRRKRLIEKNYKKDYDKLGALTRKIKFFAERLVKFTDFNLEKVKKYQTFRYTTLNKTELQRLVVSLWRFQLEVRGSYLLLNMSELAQFEQLKSDPLRIRLAKEKCIDISLQIIEYLDWGISDIPLEYWYFNAAASLFNAGVTLINALFVYDHPKTQIIRKALKNIFTMFTEIEKTSSIVAIALNALYYVYSAKSYFHNRNRLISAIPDSILNVAITDCDINPWFSYKTSTLLTHFCCAISFSRKKDKLTVTDHFVDLHSYDFIKFDTDRFVFSFPSLSYLGLKSYIKSHPSEHTRSHRDKMPSGEEIGAFIFDGVDAGIKFTALYDESYKSLDSDPNDWASISNLVLSFIKVTSNNPLA
ncbi:hypothetical protein AX774_g1036 [Zancudomyces culisetae]|uniref:Uncharacterized protein n=1 Tax=Zancudomyces culisetae TaxID=1213189 RepID=A0A1R1PVV3_ZANCU|nr:hypothetical protein AX774_g1385 [Zancudomyces culisetae]OMH85414.1 hypothetical protein AX774_g1036 [Zancudomyces culisetae]|eukprot:OMH85059.1 hypothetical protein AX774_g1385 [Zancudomyces culisetae]